MIAIGNEGPLHNFKHMGNMNRFKELVGLWRECKQEDCKTQHEFELRQMGRL